MFPGNHMIKNNRFVKEYITERKGLFDLNSTIFKKAAEGAKMKEELIKYMDEKFNHVISRIANKRAKTLMEDFELP